MLKNAAFLIFFLSVALPVFCQEAWKLSIDKEGIKVFTGSVPGSRVKAIKVVSTVNATASELVAVLLDVNESDKWVYHTKLCSLLRKVSPSELYYYSEVSLPWPCENRDFVAHISVSQYAETKVVLVDAPAVPGIVSPKDGIVRVSHSKGRWVITPLDKNQVRVDYTLQVDPAGAIPAWLVNTFAAQGPLESFRKLKQQLQLPAYRNIKLSFIVN